MHVQYIRFKTNTENKTARKQVGLNTEKNVPCVPKHAAASITPTLIRHFVAFQRHIGISGMALGYSIMLRSWLPTENDFCILFN